MASRCLGETNPLARYVYLIRNALVYKLTYLKLVNGHCEGGLGLFLRPEDPMSRPIMSQAVITNNVVLKVVVPRRTGRKRKRGTSEPFRTEGEDRARVGTSNGDGSSLAECRGSLSRQDDPGYLFQSLRDNPSRYRVEAVGTVAKTHRYRGELTVRREGAVMDSENKLTWILLSPDRFPALDYQQPVCESSQEHVF